MKDVKKVGLVGDFVNAKIHKNCVIVRRNKLWYIYNTKRNLMSNEGWPQIEVIQNYVIATNPDGEMFLFYIERDTMFPVIGNVNNIECIVEEYFVISDTGEKALYKGRQCLINYGEYNSFEVNLDFNIIIIAHDDDYELTDLNGKKLIKGRCDEIKICSGYCNSGQLIKFLRFGRWGIYKIGKGIIIEPKMNQVNVYSDYIECIIGNKKGAYNYDGDEILPIKYSVIRTYGNKVFKVAVKKGSRYVYGAFGINGVRILDCEYSRINIDLEKGRVEGEKIISRVIKKIPKI